VSSDLVIEIDIMFECFFCNAILRGATNKEMVIEVSHLAFAAQVFFSVIAYSQLLVKACFFL